ncbi:hypothetical protein FD754_010466 [Muntiacus muntjak]|uniref:U6 small nuclear RNA (adenine-(43)-N(6))-methyltransferase n=1 Tax=Muntiacus muntjak TaxID=9888 RepID=A0A5N3WWX4_MUNMU|nr:hypothetical protein FD754_010466 [Muntiacus muntjak]
MHARSRYKDKLPDFAYLATKYPDFKHRNFKDTKAVRALTCTLLKEDFGLSIDILLEGITSSVSLRLNYIHWVEDLVEVDAMCFNYAKKSVEQNNLSDFIKVVKVSQETLLMDALKEESEIICDFCMCNPLFFASQCPPSSVNTGRITDIRAEGGELEFVRKIIHDSLQLKKRLRWYNWVPKVTYTEFCQGQTMRWALAWSFYDDVTVPSPPSKTSPQASSLGSETVEGIVAVMTWIEKLLTIQRFSINEFPVPLAPKKVTEALEEKKSPLKKPSGSHDMTQGPQKSALERLFQQKETAIVQGQGRLSLKENAEPTEDKRREEKGEIEVLESCKGSSNGAQDHKASEQFSKPGSQKGNHLQGVARHHLFKCLTNIKKEVDDTLVEMHWVQGQNRNLMNQLCTYICS